MKSLLNTVNITLFAEGCVSKAGQPCVFLMEVATGAVSQLPSGVGLQHASSAGRWVQEHLLIFVDEKHKGACGTPALAPNPQKTLASISKGIRGIIILERLPQTSGIHLIWLQTLGM